MLRKGNIVLQDTIERIFGGTLFAEVKRGLFVVRGENVMLLGEIVCFQKPCFGKRMIMLTCGRI